MFKIKRLLIVALFVIGAIISPGFVQAESLPEAGESFNEATLLELNTNYNYADNRIGKGGTRVFKVEEVKPGQLLTITNDLNTDIDGQGITIKLYNIDREELDYETDQYSSEVSWMPGTGQDSYSYYLKIETSEYGGDKVDFDLNVEAENYYDGNSETDAGDELTEAIDLSTSTIVGYLSGEREGESDTIDFYKTEIEEGKMISLRLVPPTEVWGNIHVFNSDRELLEQENASNKGQIVNLNFIPEERGEYFIAIRGNSDNNELVQYTLESEIKEATETGDASQDQMPSEDEIRDIQNQIENQIRGEGGEGGWIETIRGIVFSVIKYVAIILGVIILVIIVIIVLINKSKGGKDEEKEKKEKEE